MGPLFSGESEFSRLWAEIPKVLTYRAYVILCNEIDSCHLDREITDTDERVLLDCLDKYAKIKGIPTTDPEWEEKYQ